MTLPTVGSCGAAEADEDVGKVFGTVPAVDGVAAAEGLAEDGLDHPGPVVDERWMSVVSLAVMSRE